MSWWTELSPLGKAAVIMIPGLGIGVAAAYAIDTRRIKLPGGYTPREELPDILDIESEDVPDPEPIDIQYADDADPCVRPPHPWDVPVASGLEGDATGCVLPAELEPKKKTEVAFTAGAERPQWPLDTDAKRKLKVSYQDVRGLWHGRWGREFGASRNGADGGRRRHVGIDLFADPGDVVLAMEPGVILAALPFYKGTGAVYQLTDSGHIINYGELDRGSWRRYGIMEGKRVDAGDKIAKVGLSNDGSHMLHLETYEPEVTVDQIRKGAMQWPEQDPPPTGILDPTQYLIRAQRVKYESMTETT